jgi:hypothetical protein
MSCQTIERWISDELNGRLPPGKRTRLERHLNSCPSCRACREELVRLQEEASKLFEPGRSPEYWDGFVRRLEDGLADGKPALAVRGRGTLFLRRWVWAGAAALLLAAVGVLFLSDRNSYLPEPLALSHEESLSVILAGIEADPDLAREFSEHIEASLRETAGLDDLEPSPRFRDDPFFWEGLSDEELVSLEQELRTQYRLTEVSHEVF